MKLVPRIMTALLSLALIAPASAITPEKKFRPAWDVGTSWTVKSQFREQVDRER